MRAESMGIDYAAMTAKAAQMLKDSEAAAGAAGAANGAKGPDTPADGAAAPAAAAPPAAAKPKTEEGELPPGWARAKDAQGRTYFWHTQVRACSSVSPRHIVHSSHPAARQGQQDCWHCRWPRHSRFAV